MKKLILFFSILLLSLASNAATYYIRGCGSGSQAGCATGSGNGTTDALAYPSFTSLPSLNAGDTVLFAKGSAYDGVSWGITGGTSGSNPITIDSYTSSVSTGGTNPPRFNNAGGSNAITIQSGSGYTLKNINLQGSSSNSAIFIYTNNDLAVQWITLDTVTLNGFAIGFDCEASSASVRPRFLTLKNSTITNNLGLAGVYADCDDLTVINNTISSNGGPANTDHNVYFANSSTLSNGSRAYTLALNYISDSAQSGGSCIGTHVEIEGVKTGVNVYGNYIINTGSTADVGCWGLEVVSGYADFRGPESFNQVRIDSNTFVNMGSTGLVTRSCIDCEVVNNKIIWTTNPGYQLSGMSIGNASSYGIDQGDGKSTLRNNAIYFPALSSTVAAAINITGTTGPNNTILVSNIAYFTSGTAGTCFSINGLASSHFTAFDNNLCYRAAGSGSYTDVYSTLGAAQAAGFGANDQTCSPQLVATPSLGNNYSLTWGSSGCQKNNGHSTLSHKQAFKGAPIINAPDIGPEDQ